MDKNQAICIRHYVDCERLNIAYQCTMVNWDEDLSFAIVNSSACRIASPEALLQSTIYYLTRLMKGHNIQPSAQGRKRAAVLQHTDRIGFQ